MGLDEFKIILDNPSQSFYPGQIVSGVVIVSGTVETKTQGLKIKCYGFAKVHWSETTTRSIGTGNNRRTERVTHNYDAHEHYFQFKVYVVGDGKSESRIPPGRNEYRFNFTLPSTNLPCSFQGAHGKILYEVSATIKRSWKFDKEEKQSFIMNAVLNLNNQMASSLAPAEKTASKHFCCCCCKSGPLGFEFKLQRTGFVPGENVTPSVKIFNESGRGINGVSASLNMRTIFHAEGRTKTSANEIVAIKGPGVDPENTDLWQPSLRIPPTPPTQLGGCRIIDVQYFLQVELHLPGMAINLKEEVPLIIGTIPLQSVFSEEESSLNQNTGPMNYYQPQIPMGSNFTTPTNQPAPVGFIYPSGIQIPVMPTPSAPIME